MQIPIGAHRVKKGVVDNIAERKAESIACAEALARCTQTQEVCRLENEVGDGDGAQQALPSFPLIGGGSEKTADNQECRHMERIHSIIDAGRLPAHEIGQMESHHEDN